MNQNPHYRTTLPHQIHHAQCSPIQSFPARFPVPGPLDGLNPMIPTTVTSSESQYHSHIQPFLNNRPNEQLLKTVEQKNSDRNFNLQTTNDRTNQDSYKPTNTENQFNAHCNQGAKNCIQCFNKTQSKPQAQATARSNGKIMVDVATMTDLDETDQMSWQNVSMPPNTKVAEYLTSLRQFLKLSSPNENKRKLGDVRIVTSPDGSRLYCCPECHMAYPDKSLLEPHLASHKIERRFVCGVCGAGLKRKEHLDRHQLSHSEERPYSCAACPKTFKRNEHLTRHYIVHTGEKAQGERRFVCDVCGAGHTRQEHLDRHLNQHSEVRQHACSTCGKAFKRSEHLARHLVIHTGNKTHVCFECGKGFYRRDHLLKHYSAHRSRHKLQLNII